MVKMIPPGNFVGDYIRFCEILEISGLLFSNTIADDKREKRSTAARKLFFGSFR